MGDSVEIKLILFENLFKPRQRRLAVLKYSLRLVCSLIFIEYNSPIYKMELLLYLNCYIIMIRRK